MYKDYPFIIFTCMQSCILHHYHCCKYINTYTLRYESIKARVTLKNQTIYKRAANMNEFVKN